MAGETGLITVEDSQSGEADGVAESLPSHTLSTCSDKASKPVKPRFRWVGHGTTEKERNINSVKKVVVLVNAGTFSHCLPGFTCKLLLSWF
jgi:hypothetical protein